VAIGFLGPLDKNPESVFGIPMLRGTQLAVEEANGRGGYKGKPFALKVHNDAALWGASSTEVVKMLFDENCWGMLGSIDGQSTHVSLRVALKSKCRLRTPAPRTPPLPRPAFSGCFTTFLTTVNKAMRWQATPSRLSNSSELVCSPIHR
jgi:branched-chain amino acid transport system substrate-binding protein